MKTSIWYCVTRLAGVVYFVSAFMLFQFTTRVLLLSNYLLKVLHLQAISESFNPIGVSIVVPLVFFIVEQYLQGHYWIFKITISLALVPLCHIYNHAMQQIGDTMRLKPRVDNILAHKTHLMDPLERWFYNNLKNPLDAAFIEMYKNINIALIPYILVMVYLCKHPEATSWTLFIPFRYWYVINVGRVTEHVYHWNLHRPVFVPKPNCDSLVAKIVLYALSLQIVFFYGPFIAYVPLVYPVYHRKIHHVENNAYLDHQCILQYNRTSCLDFCKSCLDAINWVLGTSWNATLYLYQRKFYRLMVEILIGQTYFFGIIYILIVLNWHASFYLLSPFLLSGIPVADGIWLWHAFTDPDDPTNIYTNSSVYLNVPDFIYNDNHHIEHHLSQTAHWAALQKNFDIHRATYALNKGNVFDGKIMRKPFLMWLWTKKFDLIAEYFITEGTNLKREDVIKILNHRTKPGLNYPRGNDFLGTFLDKLETILVKMIASF